MVKVRFQIRLMYLFLCNKSLLNLYITASCITWPWNIIHVIWCSLIIDPGWKGGSYCVSWSWWNLKFGAIIVWSLKEAKISLIIPVLQAWWRKCSSVRIRRKSWFHHDFHACRMIFNEIFLVLITAIECTIVSTA